MINFKTKSKITLNLIYHSLTWINRHNQLYKNKKKNKLNNWINLFQSIHFPNKTRPQTHLIIWICHFIKIYNHNQIYQCSHKAYSHSMIISQIYIIYNNKYQLTNKTLRIKFRSKIFKIIRYPLDLINNNRWGKISSLNNSNKNKNKNGKKLKKKKKKFKICNNSKFQYKIKISICNNSNNSTYLSHHTHLCQAISKMLILVLINKILWFMHLTQVNSKIKYLWWQHNPTKV